MENEEEFENINNYVNFDTKDWYWQIEGDTIRWWSSYLSDWSYDSPQVEKITKIESIEELDWVLRNFNLKSPLIKAIDVHAERDRRLAEGFDFDFGDERGVHRIRTSSADMLGWNEVIQLAQAQLNLKAADPEFEMQPITIATGTGVTQVTPVEWQYVMLGASAFRQPIWGASFILESMDPIPTDYANDIHWPQTTLIS